MRFFSVSLFCLFAFSAVGLFGQRHEVVIPQSAKQKELESQELMFSFYPYQGSALDLRDWKRRNPYALDVPDWYFIQAPDFGVAEDTIYGVGYLYSRELEKGQLVIVLIGDYDSNAPSYFFDYNIDKDYRNDGPPYLFPTNNKRAKRISLKAFDKNREAWSFYMLNLAAERDRAKTPKAMRQELRDSLRMEKEAGREIREQTLKEHLFLRVGGMFSLGRINYSWVNNNSGYPTNYSVSNHNKGAMVQLAWKLGRFKLSGRFSVEDIFYWTSVKETRLGEPYEICGPDGCVYFENVRVETNRDVLPTLAISYLIGAEYALVEDSRISISPYGAAGFFDFLDGEYVPEISQPEIRHPMQRRFTAEGGLLISGKAGLNSALLLDLGFVYLGFSPEGFFEAQDIRDLESSAWNIRIGLGYEVGLW